MEAHFGGVDVCSPNSAVLEDTQRYRYKVQAGERKGNGISDTSLYVSDTEPGRGVGCGGGSVGTKNIKEESQGRHEGPSSGCSHKADSCITTIPKGKPKGGSTVMAVESDPILK